MSQNAQNVETPEQNRKKTLDALTGFLLEGQSLGNRTRGEILTALREADEEATRRHSCRATEIMGDCFRKLSQIEKSYDEQDEMALYASVRELGEIDANHILMSTALLMDHVAKIRSILDPEGKYKIKYE